ncbi:MAG: hypothetical protein ACM3MG_04425 [Bacillota bacterium]
MKWSRLGLALLTALQVQMVSAGQGRGVNRNRGAEALDAGLFPIDIGPTSGTSVDDLFPTQPRIGITPPQQNKNGQGFNNGNNNNNNGNNNGIGGFPPGGVIGGANGIIRDSGVKEEFRCNLFTNSEYADIISAANLLNQAVGSATCGNSSLTAQQVVTSNKTITDAVQTLQQYLEKPETVQQDQIPTIVSKVDGAIRAANSLATTFANSDLMNKDCRSQMNGGQIALAINDLINGLTPYALMAATMTGGTAAVPFIVGGTAITGALSSMSKIVNENSTKISDPSVRRAVVENTCQFIRLDQKYRFLMQSRDQQILKISAEMTSTRNLMSAKVPGVSANTNSLMARSAALSQASLNLENVLSDASSSLDLDRQFVKGTTDDIKICSLGIQLAQMADDNTSYIATMLNSVNGAMVVYGSTNVPQARALKMSGDMAINSLKSMATTQFNFNSDFSGCARATKSLLETVAQSATLSRQLIKATQTALNKELALSPEYSQIQARANLLQQKTRLAARITNSLDNLRKYATSFNQSEIDAEMDRLRSGLFKSRSFGVSSPVMAWFGYTSGLQRSSLAKFKEGFSSIRNRAYRFTSTGKNSAFTNAIISQDPAGADMIYKDYDIAARLDTITLKNLPRGSREYNDTCREMNDVWNRWVTVVDHMGAVESFCQMIDNYIYDNRSEDAAVVQMCRGRQKSAGVGNNQSDLGKMKASLIQEKSNSMAALIKRRIGELGCPSSGSF